jgi:hypothetical protein
VTCPEFPPQYSPAFIAEKDLVAYWRFDNDSWLEYVSNTTTTTVYGDAKFIVYSRTGSHAAYFDGNGDYISMPNAWDTFKGVNEFTFQIWITFGMNPVVTGNQHIMGQTGDANWFLAQNYPSNGYISLIFTEQPGEGSKSTVGPKHEIT